MPLYYGRGLQDKIHYHDTLGVGITNLVRCTPFSVGAVILKILQRMLQRIMDLLYERVVGPKIFSNLSDEEFVGKIFQIFLTRQVDSEGLQVYTKYLAQGYSRLRFIDLITSSEEFIIHDENHIAEEFPAGSFASVSPCKADIMQRRNIDRNPDSITGIDLREGKQWELLQAFKTYYDEMPHHQQNKTNKSEFRYIWDNPSYSPSDAIATFGMMRHFRPKKIIEVGCGNSSCLMLDTNDRFFDGKIDFTLVEPYPEFLSSVLWPNDPEAITIIPEKAQDVPVSVFESLEENDILFIDSSHVSKAGSDVNYLYLDVLPRIKPGVLIHIHDIFYPFEYPQDWLEQGRFWNEQYLLRALLTNNPAFEVLLFTTQAVTNHNRWIAENMPRFNEIGGSIWLRRITTGQ